MARAPRSAAGTGLAEPKLAGEDHPLALRRSLADLQDLGVPVEPRDRELVHEPVSAEYLRRVARVVHGRIRRRELRDRGLLLERLARLPSGGRVVPGDSRPPGAHVHVSDLELDVLGVAEPGG